MIFDFVDVKLLVNALDKVSKLSVDSNGYLGVNVNNFPTWFINSSKMTDDLYSKLSDLTNALDSVATDALRVDVINSLSATISASTKITELGSTSITAGGTQNLINVSGKGELQEVTVISESSNFKLTVTVDGSVVWDKSFSDASQYTDDVVTVSAFQDENGKYIYHLSSFPYESSIKVDIVNLDSSNTINIDYAIAKYSQG